MRVMDDFSIYKTIAIFLSSACFLYAQESTVLKTFSEKLRTYKETSAPEKVYLQTDKDYYTNRDTLWFKAFVVDGMCHTPSDKSRVVYVELVDSNQKVIEQRRIYTGFEGGAGDIALAENIEEGRYFLRAFTKYMLNEKNPVIFQKEIPIWAYTINSSKKRKKSSKKKRTKEVSKDQADKLVRPKTIVQFFPEGGNLITGLNTVLGLKVTDVEGAGIALTGKILDQNDSLITMFGTYEFGLGQVQFKVETGIDYFAAIEINGNLEKYPIPKALANGYVLQIQNRGDYIQLKATTNNANGQEGSLLLGHIRGEKILEYFAPDRTEKTFEIKLSTADFDDGVATFTLFTPNGEPVCERLTFIENPNNEVQLAVKTDSSSYGFRKKVSLDLAVLDEAGIPLQGDFSLSVVTQNALTNESENIKSWLLLNSDLGGTIANPNYFFEDSSKNRKNLLDILMLTHGWRRFVWREWNTGEIVEKSRYPPEKGLIINGSTVSSKNRTEALKSSVQLNITQPRAYEEETVSNQEGRFSFGPMIFRDSLKAVIKAVHDRDDKKEVAIYLEPSFPTVPFNDSIRFQNQSHTIEFKPAFQEEIIQKKDNDFEYDPKVIKLDEYIGREKLRTKKELINEALNERTMYGQALKRIIPDSILDSQSMSVIDLIERKVPGVTVRGQYPDQEIILRGGRRSFLKSNPPLYLVDGIPVGPEFVKQMFGSEILFIDVLKTAGETAQYGMRGANGVIAVYTPRGENYEFVQEQELDVAKFTIPGFYRSKEFYSPNYKQKKSTKTKPDYRTTLHWDPNIKLSDIESTNLSFYTGDSSGRYAIRVVGVTNDGRPVNSVHYFNITNK